MALTLLSGERAQVLPIRLATRCPFVRFEFLSSDDTQALPGHAGVNGTAEDDVALDTGNRRQQVDAERRHSKVRHHVRIEQRVTVDQMTRSAELSERGAQTRDVPEYSRSLGPRFFSPLVGGRRLGHPHTSRGRTIRDGVRRL